MAGGLTGLVVAATMKPIGTAFSALRDAISAGIRDAKDFEERDAGKHVKMTTPEGDA
jgi:hypothetical protein